MAENENEIKETAVYDLPHVRNIGQNHDDRAHSLLHWPYPQDRRSP